MDRLLNKLFSTSHMSTRMLLLRELDKRFDFLPYAKKLELQSIDRPYYGHCLRQAALLAQKLGHPAISAIEFGVAGGNGLLSLERHAARVQKETGVETMIYGFDSGAGMPQPVDHRDLPYLWQAGYFQMDEEKLRQRMANSTLILGPVEQTVATFIEQHTPPPIGFIAFDLDYYSSTMAAFAVLESPHEYLLPRVACYFDDTVGDIDWAYNEFSGELLAISEFNAAHEQVKLAGVRGLRYCGSRAPALWHEQVYVAHVFHHPEYRVPISPMKQLPLE